MYVAVRLRVCVLRLRAKVRTCMSLLGKHWLGQDSEALDEKNDRELVLCPESAGRWGRM